MKKLPLVAASIMLATATLSPYAYAAPSHSAQHSCLHESDALGTLNSYLESINSRNWMSVLSYICKDEKQAYSDYFDDESQTNGLKQITDLKLQHVYTVPDSMMDDYFSNNDGSEIPNGSILKSYIVAFDCDVSTENQYFYNGINYQLVTLINENGSYKIYHSSRPTNKLMNDIVSSTNLSLDEKKAVDAVISCNNGLLKNANGDTISHGFKTVTVSSLEDESSSQTNSWPTLKHYASYSYPSSINVKLKSGGIKPVSMSSYIKCTLPNEWMASWPTESLKAGAYCVKMVGIYHTLNPVNSNLGYDVTQTTQNYIPNSNNSRTDHIIDALKNHGMGDSLYHIFFPSYGRGSSGKVGSKSSGRLLQYGSKKLAEEGHTHKYILNYYYSNSSASQADINLFTYSIGF